LNLRWNSSVLAARDLSPLGYPQPSTGGGYLIKPTIFHERPYDPRKPYASIFDVGEKESAEYAEESKAGELVTKLSPPKYKKISYTAGAEGILETLAKAEKKLYDKLRQALNKKKQKYVTAGIDVPKNLSDMLDEIYPGGQIKASHPARRDGAR
jgi:hypothetical protein